MKRWFTKQIKRNPRRPMEDAVTKTSMHDLMEANVTAPDKELLETILEEESEANTSMYPKLKLNLTSLKG